MSADVAEVSRLGRLVIEEVERAVIGKRHLLKMMMAAVLADGHVLLEDYPGLAKTLTAKSMAATLGLRFKRIQFTPDMLPGDITGGYVFNRETSAFELRKGPIFANIILADEINRASPKTQAALLEAMQERQVTLEGETMRVPEPFLVVATQNPIEYEGTFPLPEAQLDRFIMKVPVGYPTLDEEQEILQRRRERRQDEVELGAVVDRDQLLMMRAVVESIYVHADIERYIAQLVAETRKDRRVTVGASPRGSLALLKLARSWAALDERSFVLPDDIKIFAVPGLAHRLILVPDLWLKHHAAEDVIEGLLRSVPVPVIEEGPA